MRKFAAALRRILLQIFLLTLLAFCILTPIQNDAVADTIIPVIMLIGLCTFGLYIFVSLISLLVRYIKRKKMAEDDAAKDSYLGVLDYLKNNFTISRFRRRAFWGTLMLVINLIFFKVPFHMIFRGPFSPDIYLAIYHGILLWSLAAWVITAILSIIFWKVYMPHYGEGAYNIFQMMGKWLVSDFLYPIITIKSFFEKNDDGTKKKGNILSLIDMTLFIIVNVIAFLKY